MNAHRYFLIVSKTSIHFFLFEALRADLLWHSGHANVHDFAYGQRIRIEASRHGIEPDKPNPFRTATRKKTVQRCKRFRGGRHYYSDRKASCRERV